MSNIACVNWPTITFCQKIGQIDRPANLKIMPTLESRYSVFYPDKELHGWIELEIVQLTVFQLSEISDHKILSKEDVFIAAEKSNYGVFPNGLIYSLCLNQLDVVKNLLFNRNKYYHVLAQPFVHLFQDGATLSLLVDDDDSLCMVANSGFPSAVNPESVWLMVRKMEVSNLISGQVSGINAV